MLPWCRLCVWNLSDAKLGKAFLTLVEESENNTTFDYWLLCVLNHSIFSRILMTNFSFHFVQTGTKGFKMLLHRHKFNELILQMKISVFITLCDRTHVSQNNYIKLRDKSASSICHLIKRDFTGSKFPELKIDKISMTITYAHVQVQSHILFNSLVWDKTVTSSQ